MNKKETEIEKKNNTNDEVKADNTDTLQQLPRQINHKY